MPARLVTIPFSHFCEKARWALDRAGVAYQEEPWLPVLHYAGVRSAGGGRTVPVLVDGDVLVPDSTELLEYADAHRRAGVDPLFPRDEALAIEVRRWEDRFDKELGPDTRRMAYFYLLQSGPAAVALMRSLVPRWQSLVLSVTFPAARALMRKGMRIDDRGFARSSQRLEALLADVEALLADGRRYLVGDRFTAADLTFASLLCPLLLPAAYQRFSMPLEKAPAGLLSLVTKIRARSSGLFALRLYDEHR